jgi:hypothetical protein
VPTEDLMALRASLADSVAQSDEPEVREALDKLTVLASVLPLRSRRLRWRSLTYCIVDAVWSIGSHYDNVVVPLVRRVAGEHDPDGDPLTAADGRLPPDPAPLPAFLARFAKPDALVAVTNRQLTATRNGALKAVVALAHARMFDQHGVRTLVEAEELLLDPSRLEHMDAALKGQPGEGKAGVRRGYLWMLVGRDDLVKPDRMVLRALRHHGVQATVWEASVLLRAAAARSSTGPAPFTAWELDHALWREGRRLAAAGSGRLGAAAPTGLPTVFDPAAAACPS